MVVINQLLGALWCGCAVWGTLAWMGPYLQNPLYPRVPLLTLTAVVFASWLLVTRLIGWTVAKGMLAIRR